MTSLTRFLRPIAPVLAIGALVLAMGGTWGTTTRALAAPVTTPAPAKPSAPASTAARGADTEPIRIVKKDVSGKLNLNTATEEQLMLLPSVGPSKADRIVAWRKKNGGFKRTADLRRVKGFGYRTYKRLEPFLDIKGDSTLAAKR
ncbi:MAG: helix-hairpin-helix domain-containing protein [Deltaproteobacteria bacterium]|nr:helix-hairpin-helix domain-containing protein [Deltaproteobacteria bacterium]